MLCDPVNDDYVLSDWNVERTCPTSYFHRVVEEMHRHRATGSVLLIGLAGGSIIGELMRTTNSSSKVVSLEINDDMIKNGYDVLSAYFPKNPFVDHQVVHVDFFKWEIQSTFNSVIADIPLVYEPSTFEDKKKMWNKMLSFCRNGTICLFNTLSYENSTEWMAFLRAQHTRPRMLRCSKYHQIVYARVGDRDEYH